MGARAVAYARILLRGREGYSLRPSKANPRVKRWQKAQPGGKAALPFADADREMVRRWRGNLGEWDYSALMEALEKPTRGMLIEDYDWAWERDHQPQDPLGRSRIVGRLTLSDASEDIAEEFLARQHIAHPDQLIVRMLGAAAPHVVSQVDPGKSSADLGRFFTRDGDEGWSLMLSLRDQYDDLLLKMTRVWNPVEGGGYRPYNGSFLVKEGLRGGVGTAAYASQLAHHRDVGVPEVTTVADADVGSYVWATLGFDFADPHAADPVVTSLLDIRDALAGAGLREKADQVEAARRNLWERPTLHAWDIAELDRPLIDDYDLSEIRLKQRSRGRLPPGPSPSVEPLPTPAPLGKVALVGQAYQAVFRLDEDEPYEVFRRNALRRLARKEADGK